MIPMPQTLNFLLIHPQAVLLVGGFGASKYLYQQLAAGLGIGMSAGSRKRKRLTAEVLQPVNA